MYISVFFWATTTDFTCTAKIWIVDIGFLVLYASLIVKEWRIYKIFSTDISENVSVPDSMLLRGLLLLASPSVIILIVWTIVSPYKKILELHPESQEIITTCRSDTNIFFWLLLSYEFLLLMLGCVMAFLTRRAPSNYHESKHIAFSVYNGTVTIIVVVIIVAFIGTPTALFLSVSITTLFTTTVTLCTIFGGKFWEIFFRRSRVTRLQKKIANTEARLLSMRSELQRLKAAKRKNVDSSASTAQKSSSSTTSKESTIKPDPKGSRIFISTTPSKKTFHTRGGKVNQIPRKMFQRKSC